MVTFWRVNSEQEGVEWNDDESSTFIVVVAVKERELGLSTYLCGNVNVGKRKATLNKMNAEGHFTLNRINQFDVQIETGVSSLEEGMTVMVGKEALRAFLQHSHKPFENQSLELVLVNADVAETLNAEGETVHLNYPD